MSHFRTRCAETTKDGKPCPWPADAPSRFCLNHDPDRREERQAMLSARGKAAAQQRVVMRRLEQCNLRSPDDLLMLLEREALRVTNAEKANVTERSNAIRQLVGTALEVLKASELERENAELRKLLIEVRPDLGRQLKAVR